MPKKELFIIADLGGGDGGKGGVVHKICEIKRAHTVIKIGGAQGSHGVKTSAGQSFNFSHWGCGTLEGIPTFITKRMVVDPLALMYEAELLRYACGIRDPYALLTIDREALCVTPYHRIASQLRELARKDRPKGTIGTGVGEAVLDAELHPEQAIRVKDLSLPRPLLAYKLEQVRMQKMHDLRQDILEPPANEVFWTSDRALADELFRTLSDDAMSTITAMEFGKLPKLARIANTEYLATELLGREGTVVVETSHGILTDHYNGFHPHTTKLRTIPDVSFNLMRECEYDGLTRLIGVTRAYQIRHGAGPMVTECPEQVELLLPGSHKEENRWQGRVRVGPLDFVTLRYAIEACGGVKAFTGLAITWFDQIPVFGSWQYCDSYTGADDSSFFTDMGAIRVRHGRDRDQLLYQERLGHLLNNCRPNIANYTITPSISRDELIALCRNVIKEHTGIPVRMISFGPTERDKVCM